VAALLQDQCQKLAAIAGRVSKIEEITPALVSIEKTLAGIEAHLRKLAAKQDGGQPDPMVNTRRRTG